MGKTTLTNPVFTQILFLYKAYNKSPIHKTSLDSLWIIFDLHFSKYYLLLAISSPTYHTKTMMN